MKIKKILKLNKKALILEGQLKEELFDFFKTSKPYDFCNLPSPSIRNQRIDDFFDYLKECHAYGGFINKKFIGMIFVSEKDDYLYLEFMFGQPKRFSNTEMVNSFHEGLIWVLEKYKKKKIIGEIRRVHKKERFLKYIKKVDKVCKLETNNNTELIEISWEYDRLVEHFGNKSTD